MGSSDCPPINALCTRCRLPLLLSTNMPVANWCDTDACSTIGDDIEVLMKTILRKPTTAFVTVKEATLCAVHAAI